MTRWGPVVMLIFLPSILTDVFLQGVIGADTWFEIIVREGGTFAVALVVLYWKRTDDKSYQAELLESKQKSEAREQKLMSVLEEAIRVMSGVILSLDALGSAQKILTEVQSLKRAYEDTRRSDPPA